jgi:pyruvate formate lyase activating enzyme
MEALHCKLCHHRCRIPPGGRGLCGTRENGTPAAGGFSLPYYGYVTALALDPIEKKPLYHFRPGSRILSAGFAGCNLRCPFCQNWEISQLRGNRPPGRPLRPEELIALARDSRPPAGAAEASGAANFPQAPQIAYTYSEPLIHFEFLKDCMERAQERGIANVLVSNGSINPEKADEILPLVDAANIDLKCFSETGYRDILGGDLGTTLNFIRAARRHGVCLELTTLVVPGFNDSDAELDRCAEFIAALGAEPFGPGLKAAGAAAPRPPVPWHLSACHPAYRWTGAPTGAAALLRLADRARKLLPFVYTGNIAGEENDTPCPRCGALLVRRRGYRVESLVLPGGENPAAQPPDKGPAFAGLRPCRCPSCGAETPVYW